MAQDTLNTLLGLRGGELIAVTGCGGKTAVVKRLAQAAGHQKVLVMPTTKIWPMGEGAVLCTTRAACLSHRPRHGVQCLGVLNSATGKLCAPPQADWPQLTQGYDLVLMEADGSRGLPCKGWREDEPVIYAGADIILGVVPIGAVGLPATAQHVYNLGQFLADTGLNAGAPIILDALAAMAGSGLFGRKNARRVLLVNQADDAEKEALAQRLVGTVRKRYPALAEQFIVGSAQANRWAMA